MEVAVQNKDVLETKNNKVEKNTTPKDKPEGKTVKDKPEGKTALKDKSEKDKAVNDKSAKVKDTDNKNIAHLGRVLPPRKGIKASEMKEDEAGSRFPQYRGYVLSLAGSDYTVIACGVGQGEGQALPPRDVTYKINDTTLMASHGFHNDVIHFNRDMQAKIDQCEATLGKQMSLLGMAGIIKALLYNRRFFTYFKCNILAGLDQHGGGCLYVYDQMGGFKREAYAAGGSSSLDMQRLLGRKINLKTPRSVQVPQEDAEAADIVTDVFRSAVQHKIFNGHAVVIYTITKTGIVEEFRRV